MQAQVLPSRPAQSPAPALHLAGVLVDRILRERQNPPQHRFEEFQRCAFHSGVECGIVINLAETCSAMEVGVAAKLLAHVWIHADMLEEEVALENSVLLNHPVVGLRYERLEDGGGDFRVIPGTQRIADVVK